MKHVLNNWWIIAIVSLMLFLVGCLLTQHEEHDIFRAEVSLYSTGIYKDTIQTTTAMKDYKDIVESMKLATKVSVEMGNRVTPAEVKAMISSESTSGSAIFIVRATSQDPGMSIDIANAIAKEFLDEIKSITGLDNVRILDNANQATLIYDSNRNKLLNRLAFLIVGALITVFSISIKEIFSDRITLIEMELLERECNIIGILPEFKI